MHFLITIILIVFGCLAAQGQPSGYNRTYKAGTYGCSFPAAEPFGNDGMMVAAFSLDSQAVTTGIKFIRVDKYGDIRALNYLTLNDTFFVWHAYRSFTRINDNQYVAVCNVETTNGIRSWLIATVDSNAQVTNYKHLPAPVCQGNSFITIRDIKYASAGNSLLVLGHIECGLNDEYQMLLMKLDTSLNIGWTKTYGVANRMNLAVGILIEDDGYIMFGQRDNGNLVAPYKENYFSSAQMIKVDTAGTAQWTYLSEQSSLYSEMRDLARTPDNGYLYICSGNTITTTPPGFNPDRYCKGLVIKLDSARNELWRKECEEHYTHFPGVWPYEIMTEPGGNFLITGNYDDSVGLHLYEPYGGLMKFAPDGQLKWTRRYKATDTLAWNLESYKFEDGFVMNDRILLAGTFYNATNGWSADEAVYGWIVNLDSNGCVDPLNGNCGTTTVPQVAKKTDLILYPNPTAGELFIGNPTRGFLDISVTDIAGHLLIKRTGADERVRLDVRALIPGTYLCTVTSKGQILLQDKFIRE
ncbi:MAG: T9SS type A sorting domain-containing protein [Sphingobacteriales bacterium]|nr:MAG: T9SS type A sorting domain-containing protein [Sphingobacteriales bacterium]